MVLSVNTFRGLRIDASKVAIGDVLVVTMQHDQQVMLMWSRYWNGFRWLYAQKSWLPGDKKTSKRLKRQYKDMTPYRQYDDRKLDLARLDMYVDPKYGLVLDRPLHLELEASWGTDGNNEPVTREVGEFISCGGKVVSVEASTLSVVGGTRFRS